ncbi:MAG: GNAT family N-acetyltransferase [bacterium]|nr:GNAT family N-acetyltransferase [bacterium]
MTADRISLTAMTLEYAETVRQWRNQDLRPYRTPYLLTREMQEHWYLNCVCRRQSDDRYWAVLDGDRFVGMVGLTRIEWENALAEIALIVDPDAARRGYGTEAVKAILAQAFDNLGLQTVYGECYECNPAIEFWRRVCQELGAYSTVLPARKRWGGRLWNSLYFSISCCNRARADG